MGQKWDLLNIRQVFMMLWLICDYVVLNHLSVLLFFSLSSSSLALDQLERVFLRLGHADTDEQLQDVISKFLPPVLLKLSSAQEGVRKKVSPHPGRFLSYTLGICDGLFVLQYCCFYQLKFFGVMIAHCPGYGATGSPE